VEKQRVNVDPTEYIYSVASIFIDKNPEIFCGISNIIWTFYHYFNPSSVYIDVMQSNSSSVFQTSDLNAAIFRLNVVEVKY